MIVQHEFGLYGGRDGADVLDVIDLVVAPVIVIAHTVLSAPSNHQRAILEQIADRADAMVVTARERLLVGYQVDATKVVVIPHGALPESATVDVPRRAGPPRLLTWGLLGPGKGIEGAIDALSRLQTLDPATGAARKLAMVPVGSALCCEGFLARRYRTGVTVALHITHLD